MQFVCICHFVLKFALGNVEQLEIISDIYLDTFIKLDCGAGNIRIQPLCSQKTNYIILLEIGIKYWET